MACNNLAEQIQEDYLTCKICFEKFNIPKALPCLHTFCEGCIRDYTTSRSYDIGGKFPCPVCRAEVLIPYNGVSGFPDNHLVASLFDTVATKQKGARTHNPVVGCGDSDTEINISRERSYSANDLSLTNAENTNSNRVNDKSLCVPGHTVLSSSTGDLSNPVIHPPSHVTYPNLPQTVPEAVDTQKDFDVITNTLLQFGKYGASITDFMKPKGLAVTLNGEIVVSDLGGNRILVYSNQGMLIRKFVCDCKVHDVGITAKGTIIVVVHGAKSIIMKEYSFNGKLLGSYGSFFRFDNPSGLSISPDNTIIVTSIENNQVYVFNEEKKLQRRFGKKGGGDDGFMLPYYVTTNTKGNIIVSDHGNSAIKVFDKLGKFKLKFGGEGSEPGKLANPLGVATDTGNNIYVADSGNRRVQVFNSRGKHLVSLLNDVEQIGPGVRPSNIAVSSTNQMVVLLTGDRFAQVRVFAAMPLPGATDDPESCVVS